MSDPVTSWHSAGARMLEREAEMLKRDKALYTGTRRWLDTLAWRYSKHIFPGGMA